MKKEIKQALIGKTISYYDGWCGSSNYFKIGYLKKDGSSIRVFPTTLSRNLSKKGLPKDTMKLNGAHTQQHGNYADR